MSDASAAIVAGVGGRLATAAGIVAAFAPGPVRVLDMIAPVAPDNVVYPIITIGAEEINDLENGCSRDLEAFVSLHVWTQDDSWTRCRALASAIRAVLWRDMPVSGWKVIIADHENTRYLRASEYSIQHAVVLFRLVLQPESGNSPG